MSPFQAKIARGSAASPTIFFFIAVTVAMLFFTTVALARHSFIVWWDGLIQRIEPRSHMVSIWDYKGGRTT
ncbi:MAG: hypothetical protein ACE5JQ_10785 [Candidatus Methylomirabilales bacterium]